MSFLKNFLGAGGAQVVENVTTALAQAAPETASKAQLLTMEEEVDTAGTVITKLQKDLREARTHYNEVHDRYGHLMGAAENLQTQIDDPATNPEKHTSLTLSLNNLLPKIEEMAPDLDTWKHDMESTQALLSDAEAAYKQKVTDLTSAKQNLERAKHDMQHASIEEDRAKKREEDARVVAGLATSNTTGLNVATNAFQKAADQARERASASNMKADALRTAKSTDAEEDPNVKAALAAAAGNVSSASVSDRLAALRR